jgi:outer membrane usher protein
MPGSFGVFTLGAAGSRSDPGSGYAVLGGYQYQSPVFNFAVRGWWGSDEFQTLGTTTNGQLRRQLFASAGYNFGTHGTIGLAWASQQYQGLPNTGNATATYSTTIARNLFFSFSVSKGIGPGGQDGAFATLMVPLTALDAAFADVSSTRFEGRTTTQGSLTLQRPLPVGEGWGYRVRASSNDQYEAGAGYSGSFGRYALEVGRQGSSTAVRGNIAGGIGAVGGTVFLARPIVDSFAVVRVDEVPGVRVYQNGNFAGKTDASGKVILTQMMPYTDTRITVEDQDIPIDIALRANEQRVAPYYRSGVIADFAARRVVNALLEVRLPNGKPLPTGADVYRAGDDLTYPVGRDGEVFIADLINGSVYVAEWSGGRCSFVVKVDPVPAEPIPNLGTFVCLPDR